MVPILVFVSQAAPTRKNRIRHVIAVPRGIKIAEDIRGPIEPSRFPVAFIISQLQRLVYHHDLASRLLTLWQSENIDVSLMSSPRAYKIMPVQVMHAQHLIKKYTWVTLATFGWMCSSSGSAKHLFSHVWLTVPLEALPSNFGANS
jgi:hypothetical protein